jgi:hypothetical protein
MVNTRRNRKTKTNHDIQPKTKIIQRSEASTGRANSKQQKVLDLLRRHEGISIADIRKVTGWQQHSVRGFFSGVIRKKLGLRLESAKTDGVRIYRVVAAKTSISKSHADSAKQRAA